MVNGNLQKTPLKEKRILIVEDDALSRSLLKRKLEAEGYTLMAAKDGAEGLSLAQSWRPHVIILDLNMPEVDGLEFLRRFKPETVLSHSVIVVSASERIKDLKACFQLGVQSFVRKPIQQIELLGLVRRSFELIEYTRLLAQNHRLLRSTFDNMSEGVIRVSAEYRIQMISAKAAKIIGRHEDEVLDRPAVGVIGTRIAGPDGQLLQCAEMNTGIRQVPSELILADGQRLPISLSIIPLEPNAPGGGWLLLFRDLRQEGHVNDRKNKLVAFGRMISTNAKMKEIFQLIDKVAGVNVNVLIQGESGTGKEFAAREIHERSFCRTGPFHAVNCAAISPNLLESEFFGHEKGAFTDAHQTKLGRFELANGGTLFLDEVGEIPLELQSKLLRVLQERCFERVGGTKTIRVGVRIIAATNRDLWELVQERKFREDLFYRLQVVLIQLPPLRDRLNDINFLAEAFIKELNQRTGRQVTTLHPDSLKALLAHNWDGNLRELFHAIEYAFAVSSGAMLHAKHLPERIIRGRKKLGEAPAQVQEMGQPIRNERDLILEALKKTNFKKGRAAALLGIHPTTLSRKLRKYKI